MEEKVPGPSKGYQKQVKKEKTKSQPLSKVKGASHADYSSPAAKKWPHFIEAIESGDADAVKKFIEEGINVNVLHDGITPLMLAASKGQAEIAEVILQAGVNINERSDDGWTALHKAAFDQAETSIVDILLQSGIDAEAKNKSGKTALQLAEEKRHRDIVHVIKRHQQQLLIDAREWENFLKTSEGKPYQQKSRYDSLSLAFKLWWLPVLVLGGVGLLLGSLFSAVVLAGIIGIVSGLCIGIYFFLLERNIRTYLDDLGPLPYLDIHTLREKREAGEPITIEKNSETTIAEETGGEQSDADGLEVGSLDSHRTKRKKVEEPISIERSIEGGASEDTIGEQTDGNGMEFGSILSSLEHENESAPIEEWSNSRTPQLKKRVNLQVIILGAVAIIMLVIIGAIIVNRDSLTKWYYAKKIEKMGIQFSDQAFLNEVSKNNEEVLDLFIKAGVNLEAVNEQGQTALMIASEKGYESMDNKLAQLNAQLLNRVDKSGNTALMIAARQGHENIVKSLVERGADVNFTVPSQEGAASALQVAVDASDFKEEHMRIIQYLLQHGADARGRNKSGRFPLLFAADHGRIDAAKVLIEHGADVNAADLTGGFSLLSAACKGYPWFVTLLSEKGADMKMALPDGYTPLMCAVREGHMDTVNVLLERRVNVNAKTTNGLTALTDATRQGNVAIVKLFLDRGADPAGGYIPDSFLAFQGRSLAIKAKKKQLRDILKPITKTASQDGFRINADLNIAQIITLQTKGSWNKVLHEMSKKNHLLLVVKEKEVFVLPCDPATIKRAALGI